MDERCKPQTSPRDRVPIHIGPGRIQPSLRKERHPQCPPVTKAPYYISRSGGATCTPKITLGKRCTAPLGQEVDSELLDSQQRPIVAALFAFLLASTSFPPAVLFFFFLCWLLVSPCFSPEPAVICPSAASVQQEWRVTDRGCILEGEPLSQSRLMGELWRFTQPRES
jgi:hypothetical protein